jgi:hypothetical protein
LGTEFLSKKRGEIVMPLVVSRKHGVFPELMAVAFNLAPFELLGLSLRQIICL